MSNLHGIDCEDGDSRVDTEALQAWQQCVGPDKEGDHISEGGHGDGHPRMLHRLAKPSRKLVKQKKCTCILYST